MPIWWVVWIVFAGAITLFFGVLFLVAPVRLEQWNKAAAREVGKLDALLRQYRLGAGLCLVTAGLFCFASAFYVWLRLHQ